MQTFKDKNGTLWRIELNVGSAKRVKADCGVNLIDIVTVGDNNVETTVFERLAGDIELLINVLFSLCSAQAASSGIDAEKFAELFTGETVELATDALINEIINFSPPIRRKMLVKLWQMSTDLMGKMERDMDALINDPDFENELKNQFSLSSTNIPESAE
jgi:hypothetical protein